MLTFPRLILLHCPDTFADFYLSDPPSWKQLNRDSTGWLYHPNHEPSLSYKRAATSSIGLNDQLSAANFF